METFTRKWTIIFLMVALFVCLGVGVANNCYECSAGEWTDFCVGSETVTQCSASTRTCFNQVTNDNGVFTSWKGCMTSWICEEKRRQNPPGCNMGVVTDQCTYCCSEDYCNTDVFTYSATAPPPTTTTTTTLPPTTTITTLPAATTDSLMTKVTQCVDTYKLDVNQALASSARDSFSALCSKVPDVFSCLALALPECVNTNDEERFIIDYISGMLRDSCPSQCDIAAGQKCSIDVQYRILEILMDTSGTCLVLRREVSTFKQCVGHSIHSCSTIVESQYSYTVTTVASAVSVVCDDMAEDQTTPSTSTTPANTPTTTTSQDFACQVDVALACMYNLAQTVVHAQENQTALDKICTILVSQTKVCVDENTVSCTEDILIRVGYSMTYLQALIEQPCKLNTTTPAPQCDTAAARACIANLWSLIHKETDFQEACNTVDATVACVSHHTKTCTDLETTSLNNLLAEVLADIGDRCDEIVECPSPGVITVEEGGVSVWVTYTLTRNPAALCRTTGCQTYIDVIPDSAQPPYCESKYAIGQLVIGGVTPSDGGSPNYGTKEITSANWSDRHRFTVTAKVDYKIDGNQTRNVDIVMRRVVNGRVVETRVICTVVVVIIDRTTEKDICRSFNDPHLQTFDGVFYNNMHTGFYVLYRHSTRPYEVQVAYSGCGLRASCNCGVAVRSGDTVFVVDQCQRKSKRQLCRKNSLFCEAFKDVRLYYHSEITPGTRIFRRKDGDIYDVILPHGTIVRIDVFKVEVNVAVLASPYDLRNSEGLCGYYDGDEQNDFLLSDGSVYNRPLNKRREATPFSYSWRVEKESFIFAGVPVAPFSPESYCDCYPPIDTADASPYSICGAEVLLELCGMEDGNKEITHVLPRVPRVPIVKLARRKRQLEQPDVTIDDWDLGETGTGMTSSWSIEDAERYCSNHLNTEMVRTCQDVMEQYSIDGILLSCVEDLVYGGSTDWIQTTLEVLKSSCINLLEKNVTYTNTEAGNETVQRIKDLNCPYDCSGHGQCFYRTCLCDDGYEGPYCLPSTPGQTPQKLFLDNDGVCLARTTNCVTAVLYGQHFTDQMTCLFTPVKIPGLPQLPAPASATAVYLSPNQVLCPLPKLAPVKISLTDDRELTPTESVLYVPYDDACYDCGDDGCSTKTSSSCIIDEQCYAAEEVNSTDRCLVCDPGSSHTQWSDSNDSECPHRVLDNTSIIIIAVVCVAVVLVLLLLVVCCLVCRKKEKSKTTAKTNVTTVGHHNVGFEKQCSSV